MDNTVDVIILMTPLIFNCHITMAEPAVTLADVAYCS
jgi:hypothetical protein